MESKAQNGVWPVMLTPFTDTGRVDYKALEALIQWYEERGVSGLFAVCQSSEMFFLSLQERVELSRFIKRTAHVPVISSGHTSYSIDDQIAILRQKDQKPEEYEAFFRFAEDVKTAVTAARAAKAAAKEGQT